MVTYPRILPADHSAWAKSVRWSCGRPGYRPTIHVLDRDELAARVARDVRMAAYVSLGINQPSSRVVII